MKAGKKSEKAKTGPSTERIFDFSVLRELRRSERLSIGEVSRRSAVSAAVISKLERNRCGAELPTIHRLGRVFGLSPSDLLALAETGSAHRKKARSRSANGFRFSEISYGRISCLLGSAPKGARTSRPEIHRDDYELCWILDGKVRISLPHETHVLSEGEAIQFDATLEHSYEVISSCKMLIVHIRKEKRF